MKKCMRGNWYIVLFITLWNKLFNFIQIQYEYNIIYSCWIYCAVDYSVTTVSLLYLINGKANCSTCRMSSFTARAFDIIRVHLTFRWFLCIHASRACWHLRTDYPGVIFICNHLLTFSKMFTKFYTIYYNTLNVSISLSSVKLKFNFNWRSYPLKNDLFLNNL